MNSVVLVGRLARDVELRATNTGTRVINFCIAVKRSFSKNDEADFIECTAWDKTADVLSRFFHKGSWISVRGDLRTRMKERNGVKYKEYWVNVTEISFAGDKNASFNEQPSTNDFSPQPQTKNDFIEIGNDDDLPF